MSGQIHDIGYKRYVGTRLSTGTRWRVIMREQISFAWKKWWRYKLALGGTVITAFVAGGIIYFSAGKILRSIGNGAANQMVLTFADGVLPLSVAFFCRMAFVLSLTLGATIIANDTQTGAFTFYYVRSVRPRDYVLGKLAGYGFLVGTLVVIGPLLVALFRLGMSDDTDQFLKYLPIVPKIIGIGLLATLVYTAVPLAISAMVPNRRYALALWAAYYLIVSNIALAIGAVTKSPAMALDIQTSLQAVTFELFDIPRMLVGAPSGLDGKTALIALLAQGALAIALMWFMVASERRSGVGGAS